MSYFLQFRAAIDRLPPRQAAFARAAVSVVLGLAAAVMLSYVFYRVGLPSKPFIYVSF